VLDLKSAFFPFEILVRSTGLAVDDSFELDDLLEEEKSCCSAERKKRQKISRSCFAHWFLRIKELFCLTVNLKPLSIKNNLVL
jgi:hypothetical protein